MCLKTVYTNNSLATIRSFFNFLRQLRDDLPVDNRIHVRTQHEQYPPIPQVHFPAQRSTNLYWDGSVSGMEDPRSNFGTGNYDYPVYDQERQHSGKDHVPEPNEDVGLLVDDIQRE